MSNDGPSSNQVRHDQSTSINNQGRQDLPSHYNEDDHHNNIAESLTEASNSLIPSRHQQRLDSIQVHEWQPDDEVSSCPICESTFTFWVRKHHCRKCGRVVCNNCSLHEITYLPSTYVVSPPSQIFLESPHVPHRTCDQCYEEVEMIRSALNESLNNNNTTRASVSTDSSSSKDLSVTRTLEVPNNGANSSTSNQENDSFKDRCPVCNKFIGCFPEQQKEEHINDCLVNLEFSGSPKQQRTNNRMLVYTMPTDSANASSSAINIPTIDDALGSVNVRSHAPSTSMDTLTINSDGAQPLSSSAKSGTSTLNFSEEEKGEDSECVICFEEFKPGDKVARMECLCVFHYRCIKDWFKRKGARECPVHTLHYE